MAKFLLGWEFGAGLGHVAILAPIAAGLLARGHEVTVAARSRLAARSLPAAVRVLPAPFWAHPPAAARPTETLADVFAGLGYADPVLLGAMTRAWAGLIDVVRPDVAVAEFAPTLALAARGRLPVATVGTGFTIPPGGGPLPAVKAWEPTLSAEAVAAEARVQAALGAVGYDHRLADLLTTTPTFVCAVPALDPYRGRRAAPASGPLGALAGPRTPPKRALGFAYLAADLPNLSEVLATLAGSGVPFEAYVRGLDPARSAALARPGLGLHDAPVDLRARIGNWSVLVHHGGLGTAHEALFAGVPQLVLPKQLEQALTLRALEEAGVGTGAFVTAPDGLARLREGVRALVGEPAWRARATALGADLHRRYPGAADTVVTAISGLA